MTLSLCSLFEIVGILCFKGSGSLIFVRLNVKHGMLVASLFPHSRFRLIGQQAPRKLSTFEDGGFGNDKIHGNVMRQNGYFGHYLAIKSNSNFDRAGWQLGK